MLAVIALSFSGGIVLFNVAIRLMVILFSKLQKYISHSNEENAFMNIYLIFSFLNAGYAIYFVIGSLGEQGSNEQLLLGIAAIMLANVFSDPVYKLVDPLFYYQWVRMKLALLRPQVYPQFQLNEICEGYACSLGDNYQYLCRCMLLTLWFSSALPVLVLATGLAMLLNHWVDRLYLALLHSTPPSYNQMMPRSTLWWLYFAPVIYVLGALQFRNRLATHDNIIAGLYELVNYGVTSAAMVAALLGYWVYGLGEELAPAKPDF